MSQFAKVFEVDGVQVLARVATDARGERVVIFSMWSEQFGLIEKTLGGFSTLGESQPGDIMTSIRWGNARATLGEWLESEIRTRRRSDEGDDLRSQRRRAAEPPPTQPLPAHRSGLLHRLFGA